MESKYLILPLKIEDQGVSSESATYYHPIMYTPPYGKCVDVDTREKVTSSDVNNVNTCEVQRNTTNNVNVIFLAGEVLHMFCLECGCYLIFTLPVT